MSIDVTNCNLRTLVAKAYDLSSPRGMGFLHFNPKPLSETEIDAIIERGDKRYPVDMDYVNGRSIKLHVRKTGDKLFISDPWYDHDSSQLDELCAAIGAKRTQHSDAQAGYSTAGMLAAILLCAVCTLSFAKGGHGNPAALAKYRAEKAAGTLPIKAAKGYTVPSAGKWSKPAVAPVSGK